MVPIEARTSRVGKSPFGIGVVGAVIGSICCALPAAAISLGLAGVSGLVSLSLYQPYFLATSLLFVAGGSWYLGRRRTVCCSVEEQRRMRYTLPAVAIGTYLVIYVLINYVVVPLLYRSTASI